jgi:hypothetical protein
MNLTKPRSRRSNRPAREYLNDSADRVAVWSNAWHGGSLRIKWNRLDDDEALALVKLTDKAAQGRGFDPKRLDKKEQGELEALVEKGAALGLGWFRTTRETDAATREVRRMIAEASRPPQPTVADEERLVRVLHALVKQRALHIDRLGVFIYILGQILSYEAESPGARLEGAGDETTLVLNRTLGLGLDHDPHSNATVRWQKAVEQLARNQLLEVDQLGQEFHVRMGERTLTALGRGPTKDRTAA